MYNIRLPSCIKHDPLSFYLRLQVVSVYAFETLLVIKSL